MNKLGGGLVFGTGGLSAPAADNRLRYSPFDFAKGEIKGLRELPQASPPPRAKQNGSLLFETFVALMILSIGITSTLRVFSEALFVGTRNMQKSTAQEKMSHLLFEWFVHPGGVNLPDAGTLTLPMDSEGEDSEWTCTIRSQNLSISAGASAPEKAIQAMKASQYYGVKIIAQKNQRTDLLDLETVVFRSQKASA